MKDIEVVEKEYGMSSPLKKNKQLRPGDEVLPNDVSTDRDDDEEEEEELFFNKKFSPQKKTTPSVIVIDSSKENENNSKSKNKSRNPGIYISIYMCN